MIKPLEDKLIMCEVQTGENKTHDSNMRVAAAKIVTDEWWFGFEQEYFFTEIEYRKNPRISSGLI